MQLAICELSEEIVIHSIITMEEFYDNSHSDLIFNLREQYVYYLSLWADRFPPHHIAYSYFIDHPFIKIEIIYADEHVCFKTYWIRFIQRRWRNIFKKRKDILTKRKQPKALRIRQTTGKWPKGLHIWPKFNLTS